MYINNFENQRISFYKTMYLYKISLFLLLYADDTVFFFLLVLFVETVDGLQKMLDTLYTYSTRWNIDVNIDTTKLVVFRNGGKLCRKEKWIYNDDLIETVYSFNYLGVNLQKHRR